jgi:hypothetical protein
MLPPSQPEDFLSPRPSPSPLSVSASASQSKDLEEHITRKHSLILCQEKGNLPRTAGHEHTRVSDDYAKAEHHPFTLLSVDRNEAAGGHSQFCNIARPPWIAPLDWSKCITTAKAPVSDALEAKQDPQGCGLVLPELPRTTLTPSVDLVSQTSSPTWEEKISFVDDDPEQVAKM